MFLLSPLFLLGRDIVPIEESGVTPRVEIGRGLPGGLAVYRLDGSFIRRDLSFSEYGRLASQHDDQIDKHGGNE